MRRKLGESLTESLFVAALQDGLRATTATPAERKPGTEAPLQRHYPSTGPEIVRGPYAAIKRLPR